MNIKIENVQVRDARCACGAYDPEQAALRPRIVARDRCPLARQSDLRSRNARISGVFFYKRTTGLEPATFGLGSRRSTN